MKALIAIATALMISGAAHAHEFKVGALEIHHPYIPTPAKTAKTAGGFFTVKNEGAEPDRLLAVESDIADKIQIHDSTVGSDGVAKMEHVETLAIPANTATELSRGGLHVMFMGLKAPLEEGKKYPATLVFEKAGKVAVEFSIDAPKEGGAEDHSAHGTGAH